MDEQSVGLKHAELTDKIIGVYDDVYNQLGHSLPESVYEESMAIALHGADLAAHSQVAIPVLFCGRQVGNFWADLFVDDRALLELEAARTLDRSHEAQLLHYLPATEIETGLLLNFGEKPQFQRLLADNERKGIRVHPCQSVAGGGS